MLVQYIVTELVKSGAHDLVTEEKTSNCVFYLVIFLSQAHLAALHLFPDVSVHFHTSTVKCEKAHVRERNIYTSKQLFYLSLSSTSNSAHTYIHTHTRSANPQLTPNPFSEDFAKAK